MTPPSPPKSLTVHIVGSFALVKRDDLTIGCVALSKVVAMMVERRESLYVALMLEQIPTMQLISVFDSLEADQLINELAYAQEELSRFNK